MQVEDASFVVPGRGIHAKLHQVHDVFHVEDIAML